MQTLPPAMLALSDSQLSAIMLASRPLQPKDRDPFFRAVCDELAKLPELGDGAIHRTIRETQKRFFDAPDLCGSVSKWDR